MTHPLELVSPTLAAAVGAVAEDEDKTAKAIAALVREGVRSTSTYTQGPVWGPLYGALANNSGASDTTEFDMARAAAREALYLHEIDGMEILARLEGRVAMKPGDTPPTRGQYENHHNLTWRLRAMLLAFDDPYQDQLLDIVHCLYNGGMDDTDITNRL